MPNRRALSALLCSAVLAATAATCCYAAEPLVIRAQNADFNKLKLTARATPSRAASSGSILISIHLFNPTESTVEFLSTDVFLSETAVAVRKVDGTEVKGDHPIKRASFQGVRTQFFAPGHSNDVAASLYDLGYDLGPGSYIVTVSHYSAAQNLKPIYADPITVEILR